MTDDLTHVCSAADVPLGGAIKVETEGLTLAVFNIAGVIFVTDDDCTHGPGSLSEGEIEGCMVTCIFHQGAFDIRTGAVMSPPCVDPVRTYPVETVDDAVYIDRNREREG